MAHSKGLSSLLLLALASLAGLASERNALSATVADLHVSTVASRVSGDWHSSPLVRLPGSQAHIDPSSDLGPANPAARLERMILLLQPSAAQTKALDAKLADQQDRSSSGYHQWMRPEEFADQYANSSDDVATVVAWLQAQGFATAPVPASRGWIEFSGNVSQFEQAFDAGVRAISTAGGPRFAVVETVSVPAALRPLIRGLVSLDGVVARPALTPVIANAAPGAVVSETTTREQDDGLSPKLAAQMLHLDAASTAGTGQTIAIPGRSNISLADVAAFRSAFGLSEGVPEVAANGADPGRTSDAALATLETSWAGVAAPGAHLLVAPAASTGATDGLDLSLAGLIDGNRATSIVVGFTSCEAALSDTHGAFYAALYRQASAQGITVIAAAGDSGASACQVAGGTGPVTTGIAVNALASTPWNTAISSAALKSSASLESATELSAWSPVNSSDPAYASGGGPSSLYAVPAWQPLPAHAVSSSAGVPFRLLPDLVLPTAVDSALNRGLAFCLSGEQSQATGTNSCQLVRSGGSAASAALFAGVAAVLAEKYGSQGNVAPRLYALANRGGVFQDIQQGTAQLACATGTRDCGASGTIGFAAVSGYDMATGLGSVDAQNLAAAWATPDATGTGAVSVVLSVTPTVPNVTYNPTAQVTLTANIVSLTGGATPTGTVLFTDTSTGANLNASGSALDANGVASYTFTTGLANGGNNIKAVYSGDSVYASVTSQPLVVTAEPSTTSLTTVPSTTTPTAGLPFTATVNLAVGTPPEGTVAPTGKVTLNVDGLPTATASLATVNGVTTATFPSVTITSAGSHTLQAVYAGDANYDASTAPPVTVTIGKGATVTALTALPATLTAGTTETFTATIAPASAASGTTYTITGTVSFYDGITLLGTAVVNANTATLGNIALAPSVLHTITAVYSGDTSWSASTSNAITLQSVLLPDTVTLSVNVNTTGPGQVVTLLATVTPIGIPATNVEQNPSGNVIFYDGTTILGTVALSASLNYSSTATLITGALPGGQNILTAVYVGDLYYAAGTSNQVTIDVQDFTITPSPTNPGTNLNIIKGSSGSASYIVTGLGGFNNEIQVVCAVPTQDDMTCTASPQQVTPTGTVTFTVQTFAAGGVTTSSRERTPLWPGAAGGVAFAALGLLLLPIGRRARLFTAGERARKALMLVLLLIGFGAVGIGCSSSVQLSQNSGTPLGVATLKVTAASYIDNTVVSHSLYLTVNVLPPVTSSVAKPGIPRR